MQSQQLLFVQNICLDIETKIAQKDKELEKSSSLSSTEKAQAKAEAYLGFLEELAQKDKGFGGVLLKLKTGLSGAVKELKKDRD